MFHRLPPPVLAGSRRLVPYSQRSGPEPGPPALVTLRVFRSYSFPLNRFRRAPAARCCRSSLSVFNSSSVLPIIACLSAFPTGSQPVQRDHMFVTFTYTCYMLTRIHPPRYNSRLRPPPRRFCSTQASAGCAVVSFTRLSHSLSTFLSQSFPLSLLSILVYISLSVVDCYGCPHCVFAVKIPPKK